MMKIKTKARQTGSTMRMFTSIVINAALVFETGGNWKSKLKSHNLIGFHGRQLDKLCKVSDSEMDQVCQKIVEGY